ncbi:CBM96 family carbohydrate-binding protein [Algibacter lectus]|uniref:CBM96 family carbohydrate-binding protein n=1 Tax=Algibacter lectus TaxID=221126 RepID=UPI0009F2DAE6|nr:DNRLRE domain-containing protein [Algibacter lectus]
MKNYYFFKHSMCFVCFFFLSLSIWATDEMVSPGGDIQTAIDNVAASGGGVVTLAAGTHNITVPVRMKSNVTLQGEGQWASLLKTTVNMKMIIADSENLVNLIIQNLAIEGTNAANGGGIEITANDDVEHDNVQILNVHCTKTGWGVHIKGTKNLLVKDCLFDENGTAGQEGFAHNMYLRRVYGAEVRDSRFLNSTSANGINISYSEDIKIYNCEMSGNYFRGVRAANTDGYLVYDCIVQNNGNVGILANSEGVPTTNIDIRRNCVSNNTLEGISGVNGVTGIVTDNNAYGNDTDDDSADYSLPGGVNESGNISDASVNCAYQTNQTRILLSATSGINTVELNWTLDNVTTVRQDVFRDTDADASGRTLIASNVSGTTYTDNSVVGGTDYWYWIKASDISENTINSNAASANPSSGEPSVELSATAGDGFVTLDWDIENIDIQNVGVFRDTDDNASGRQLIKNGLTGTSYTDTSVENGTQYWYWLKVTDVDSKNFQNDPATYALPTVPTVARAQFIHPGISHKKSDLDRMKYMVEAEVDPWYASYQDMVLDSKSSYDYVVQGDETFTELGRDSGVNYGAWNSDIRAAYYNAIRWYITGDTRHADKAVEIFKAWSNLTSVTSGGTEALSGGVAYIMVEAAEIIKSTYPGWEAADVQAFKDMLVYPGYSTTTEPADIRNNATFYWKSYLGDPVRHGNQGLSGWRTVMAMGIFLDNETMYNRAYHYIKGTLDEHTGDLAYPAGPNTSGEVPTAVGEHSDTYGIDRGYTEANYGYNEVMTNYIYENGQCQESSRDQAHVMFGLGLLGSMAEMAWNQGDDLYSHEDDRFLKGLEFSLKYNVTALASYPDQTTAWEPDNFITGFDRTGRWYSKSMSPDGIGGFTSIRPNWEMSTAHYIGRGFKTEEEAKWTQRARDKSIELGGYEKAGWSNDAIGWGALTFRRPVECFGDPIIGFDVNGLPDYAVHTIAEVIEAENFDYDPLQHGEGRIYNDLSVGNSGGAYRMMDNVDVETIATGGYNLTDIEAGEWLTYTVSVPETAIYSISIKYAASQAGGAVKFSFGGEEKTIEQAVPFGAPHSEGDSDWKDYVIAEDIQLEKGVQSLKIYFSGVSNAFKLDNFTLTETGIVKQDQTIQFFTISNKLLDGDDFDPEATATSDLSVSYSSSNTSVATIVDGMVHIVGLGKTTITATQEGDAVFNEAPSVSQELTVVPMVAGTLSLGANADTYVHEGKANDNFGEATSMVTKVDARYAILKFNLSTLPGDVISAKLRLYQRTRYRDLRTVYDVADDSWTETGITWNNKPDYSNARSEITTAASTWCEWDVSSYVAQEANGDKVITFAVKDPANSGVGIDFYTKELGETVPELVIEYAGTSLNVNAEDTIISMYPNPVSNALNISLGSANLNLNKTSIKVFALSGQKVLETKPKSNNIKLDVSQLNSGIYMLMISDTSKNITRKIVKL